MAERRPRGARIDPSRLAALEVLKAVRVDDAYANLALPKVLAEHGLTGRDAAFTTELVSGTIRLQGTYDAIIDACLTKPRLEAKVRDVLRLGAHQLLSMRVPDHAAISSSVELARARIGVGPGRARQRRAAQGGGPRPRRVDPPGRARTPGRTPSAMRPSPTPTPAGWSRSWPTRWPPRSSWRTCSPPTTPHRASCSSPGRGWPRWTELVEAGGTASTMSPYAVELPGGDPAAIPAVAEGRAGVQDEGSQLVALALAGRRARGQGRAVARRLRRAGRQVGAARRPRRPAGRAAAGQRATAPPCPPGRPRLPGGEAGLLGVVTGDGTRPPWRDATFDRVLVDAPCSGLGALRRRPESRWRRSPATSTCWCRSSGPCSTMPSTRSVPEGWWSMRPAPRSWRRPPRWSRRWSAPQRRVRRRDAPALAAPGRHRRDVHRDVAPR